MFGTETISLKVTQGCLYEEDLLSGGFRPPFLAAYEMLSPDELCVRTVTCMSAFGAPLRVWFGSVE